MTVRETFLLEFAREKRNHFFSASILLHVLFFIVIAIFTKISIEHGALSFCDATMLSFHNTFTQFGFVIYGILSVFLFGQDFKNGVYDFYKQLKVPFEQIIIVKTLLILCSIYFFQICVLGALLIIAPRIVSSPVFVLALFASASVVVISVFIAASGALLSRSPLIASVVILAIWLISSVVNFFAYGLFLQIDTNSWSSYSIERLLGYPSAHEQLVNLNYPHVSEVTILLHIFWICMVSIFFVFSLKTAKKKGA